VQDYKGLEDYLWQNRPSVMYLIKEQSTTAKIAIDDLEDSYGGGLTTALHNSNQWCSQGHTWQGPASYLLCPATQT